jgi:nitrite reductase/ring-hydroxylating ferredoxin subunit/uncharacterized membrane protein
MKGKNVMAAIDRQQWLNPVEKTLQTAVHKAFGKGPGGQKVKNFLHGVGIGHPLHVIITDVPIGSWTAAIICDSLELVTGNEALGDAADYCIGIGLAGAAGAAITGLTDWSDVDGPARRVGLVHAALNIAGVALQTSSLVARRKSRAKGKGLSALGFLASAAAAWFGGELVYEQRIGVDRTAGQNFPSDWVAVLPETALVENQPRRVEHEGVPIVVIRRNQTTFALPATCSHLGGPLDEGQFEGNTVQCPWHGSRFSLVDGTVVGGPAVHALPCLEARVRDGQVEVRKAKGEMGVASGRADRPARTGTMG